MNGVVTWSVVTTGLTGSLIELPVKAASLTGSSTRGVDVSQRWNKHWFSWLEGTSAKGYFSISRAILPILRFAFVYRL